MKQISVNSWTKCSTAIQNVPQLSCRRWQVFSTLRGEGTDAERGLEGERGLAVTLYYRVY